jgi:hypothetical protein
MPYSKILYKNYNKKQQHLYQDNKHLFIPAVAVAFILAAIFGTRAVAEK